MQPDTCQHLETGFLPTKLGGLGLRDPESVWPSCLLANVTTVRHTAEELGADSVIMEQLNILARSTPQPSDAQLGTLLYPIVTC